MKPLLAFITTVALALGLLVAQTAPASANDTNTVDYEEFAAVKMWDTPAQVAKIFDSAGVTDFSTSHQLVKRYRVDTGHGRLDVGVSYYKWDGWHATQKWVNWTWEPNPAHDPATKSEFVAIKQGMTLAQVRAIIGSPGVRSGDSMFQKNAYGFFPITYRVFREYSWPDKGGIEGHVVVEFEQIKGVLRVSNKGGVVWP